MAYCTQAQLAESVTARKLIELCDDEKLARSTSTLSAAIALNSAIDTRLDAAIAKADGICDSYLRNRYDTPLTEIPDALNVCAIDLAIYYLYRRRRLEFNTPESVREDYDDAMAWLKDLSNKLVELGIDEPAASSKDSHAYASYGTARFTTSILDGSG